jgi:LL-diaminopimelate aminotransferase
VGIELNSMSKPFNMTGWRMGMAVGNAEIIGTIAAVKSNVDSGQFNAIQEAAVVALSLAAAHYEKMNALYQKRRDFMVDGLHRLGWSLEKPKATFYLWVLLQRGIQERRLPENCWMKQGLSLARAAVTVNTASSISELP